MAKHYAVLRSGQIQPHVFAIFSEDRLEQGLGTFIRSYLKVWSDWVFKYDTKGAHRQAYGACAQQGRWKAAFGAVRQGSSFVYNDVFSVAEMGYNPERFAHTLQFFRDGFMQNEAVSLAECTAGDKINEDNQEV